MAQSTKQMQIVVMAGVGSASVTPFYNPLPVAASGATINNVDGSAAITVSTDSTGSPSISIAHGASYTFQLSGNQTWAGVKVVTDTYEELSSQTTTSDLMFYVSGAVTLQPVIVVSA